MDNYSYVFEIGVTILTLIILTFIAIWIAKLFSKSNVVGGIAGFAVFLATMLLMATGTLDIPFTDWVMNGFVNSGVAKSIAFSSTSSVPTTINMQVDVPPPTVVVQNAEVAPSASEPTDTVESVDELTVEVPEEVISEPEAEVETSESSMSDPESITPDGTFDDGVPYFIYKVQSGDTIYNIRRRFGLSEAEILRRNPELDIRRPIIIGQKIKITIIE